MKHGIAWLVRFAVLVLGVGLTLSPAWAKTNCGKDCKTQISAEFKACKTAAGKDKTKKKECSTEKKTDATACKIAANPTPPNCGGTEDADGIGGDPTPSFVTCSPVGAVCGSCGSGLCFSPVFDATSGACVDVANSSRTPCSIDPPTPCPPGEGYVVVQFSPAMLVCTRPCL